ncbi:MULTISPECIES: hypothetical protein [Acidithiobacillus]|uniref:Uncharacterized protein n=1 Tax=Acidithiobacillus ferruginosus TaxID=3063951 RepID=A0ACD5IHQ7_9PROT|nr:hypothetical protein [Acidithiobacillus ferruginosus]MBU2814293.1 hypothetical protein [Acidithiobacillus ferruginosus]
MSSPRVENMKQWLQDATPEQRQELERIARTAADMVEGLNRAADIIIAPVLRKVQGGMESPEGKALMAHFDGIALLVDTFQDLQNNPVIQGSPMAADFVRNVINEFDNVSFITDPSDVLASVQAPKIERAARSKNAKGAAAARHATRNELKEKILAECLKLQKGTQWKNPAARKVAPDAFQWNNEAHDKETGRTHFTWLTITAAEKQVRRWLDNPALRA